VVDKFFFYREVCKIVLDEQFEEDGLLGDEVVETNECKIVSNERWSSEV